MMNFCDYREVLIMADFNLPPIKCNRYVLDFYVTPTNHEFLECFNSIGEPIRTSENILHLVLSTETDKGG